MTTTTDKIATFLETWWDKDLPEAVVHEGKRSLLNILGASVGAVESEPIRVMRQWAGSLGDSPICPILWTHESLSAEHAALINAAAMHVMDFNDTHIPTHAHAGAPIIASALSAMRPGTPGKMFLKAMILGMEVHFAVARAIMPSHFRKGFHITATGGAIGAAAAASLLLGHGPDALRNALSTAMLTIGGQRDGLTTMSNAYGVGNGARTGVAAALIAGFGFTSSMTAFDGQDGVRQGTSTADVETVAAAMAGLGTVWTILENSYKYYPTETISQAVVQGALRLRDGISDADAASVQKIELFNAPLVAEVVATRTVWNTPKDMLTRTFDTKFCTATAWLHNTYGPKSLMPDPDEAARVMALRERVTVSAEPKFRVEQATVRVTLADGRVLETFVDGYTGSAANPMSDDEVDAKFRWASKGTPYHDRAEEIIRIVWNIDDGREADSLFTLTRKA